MTRDDYLWEAELAHHEARCLRSQGYRLREQHEEWAMWYWLFMWAGWRAREPAIVPRGGMPG